MVKEEERVLFRLAISLLFIISPFLTSGVAFVCLASNVDRKFSQFVLSLFLGLYGYLFIPAFDFDLIRHYEYFDNYQGKTFGEFFFLITLNSRPDILLYSLYWLIGRFSESHQVVGFIGAFPFYLLLLLSIDNFFKIYLPQRTAFTFIVVFAVFMSLTVPWTFSTMRNGNAIALFVFLVSRDRGRLNFWRDAFLFTLPGLIHFSLFPVSLLYLYSKYFSFKACLTLAITMVLIAPFVEQVLIGLYALLHLSGGIGYFISAKINSYVITGVDVNFFTGSSFRYYFAVIPLLIFTSLLWLFVNQSRNVKNNPTFFRLHKFTLVLISFSICFVTTYLFARVHLLYIYIFPIYILGVVYRTSITKSFRSTCLMFLLYLSVSFLPSLISGREYRGFNPKLVYSSFFTILKSKVQPQDYWVP